MKALDKPIQMPSVSKADSIGLVVMVLLFGLMPVWGFFESFGMGVFTALLCWPFVGWFFGPSVPLIGAFVEITDRGLAFRRRGKVEWELRWDDVRAATIPRRTSPQREIAFQLADGTRKALWHFDAKSDLYTLIAERLPSGVTIEREETRYLRSRRSYGIRSLVGLVPGVGGLSFSIWASARLFAGETLPFSTSVPGWVAILSLVPLSYGLLQLAVFLIWKASWAEDKPLPIQVGNFNLMAAMRDLDQPGTQRFAYPERLRKMDLKRELLKGWIAVGLLWLMLGGLTTLALFAKPGPNEKPTAGESKAMLASLTSITLLTLTAGALRWRVRFIQTHPNLDSEVVIESKRLYLIQNGERWPVEIVNLPKLTPFSRDSSGLLSSSMVIEAGGKRRWLDPVSMLKVEN